MDQDRRMDILLGAVLLAGKAVLDIPFNASNPREKEDRTPVTEADFASNNAMSNWIRALDPESLYVSEEIENVENYDVSNQAEFWLADPLDGTSEFLAGNAEYGVCLAFISKGSPIGGAIFLPAFEKLYWGWDQFGSRYVSVTRTELDLWQNDVGALVQRIKSEAIPIHGKGHTRGILKNPIDVLCSRRHGDQNTESHIAELPNAQCKKVGACVKFIELATGNADYYPRLISLHEWDIAAGHAILKYAGGSVTEFNSNKELEYGNPRFMAKWFQAFS